MQPTIYWKNCLQQNLPVSLNPRFLYRGFIPSLLNSSSLIASQFALVAIFKDIYCYLIPNTNINSMKCVLVGSFMGGFVSGIWSGPIQLAMIQQQRFGMSLAKCVYKIIREYGLDLFRGTFNTCMREGSNIIFINMLIY